MVSTPKIFFRVRLFKLWFWLTQILRNNFRFDEKIDSLNVRPPWKFYFLTAYLHTCICASCIREYFTCYSHTFMLPFLCISMLVCAHTCILGLYLHIYILAFYLYWYILPYILACNEECNNVHVHMWKCTNLHTCTLVYFHTCIL